VYGIDRNRCTNSSEIRTSQEKRADALARPASSTEGQVGAHGASLARAVVRIKAALSWTRSVSISEDGGLISGRTAQAVSTPAGKTASTD
jgi:hypothetical protein